MSLRAETIRRHGAAPTRHRSVNLEHDHVAAARSHPFILTACARRAIQRIIDGLSSLASPRAWTLTGPFGTGKSSFCLFLSNLLSPSSSAAGEARRLLKAADPSLDATLRGVLVSGKGLVPVAITGSREPLVDALVRGLVTALESSDASGAKRLAREVREGANDARRDPLKLVDRAVACLGSATTARGVLIVIDELGKLLEYASTNPKRSDVYLLQRLAEYAARAETPVYLIGVLHQDFAGYAQELPETDRNEWEKVRGRFEDIVFEQSADDMLRLIGEAMSARQGQQESPAPADYTSLCRLAWRSKIIPVGLESAQGLPLLTACYPLHPCVTLLLGPIFKRFGQNERSAFSFLASGEPHALTEFRARAGQGDVYSIGHLYQYLVGVFGDALLGSKDGKRWAEAFNVEAQHPDLTRDELSVLRAVALLGIVGRWNGVAPTPAVLAFALSPAMSSAEVERATQALLTKSAIVYRRFNDTYSLWEGSDIDVQARIADARARIAADASTVQLLRSHFTPRPLVARKHSFETGTLRYFDVVFATQSTMDDTMARIDCETGGTKADGHVIIVLPDARGKAVDAGDPSLQALTARPDTVLCVPGNAREVESLARELSAVEWVRTATADLQSDATARRELAAREEDVRRRLEQAVAEILTPSQAEGPRPRWYRLGEEEELATPRAVNELLSKVCSEVYCDAPTIENEIINRRELSSSAAAAQGSLIDHMLRHGTVEGLGIEGNPPERSIYLSVLRALKLHHEHHGQWAFAASEKAVRKDAQPAYRAIRNFFQDAADAPRSLDRLFALLRRPPFGLRNGVIPIFVCAALLGNDADVAVYEDEAFLPQLTDSVFEKLVKDPARFTVRRWHVSGVRVTVLEQLGKMLGKTTLSAQVEPRDLLDVVKPLVRFIRKLNDFSRQTKIIDRVAVAVRESITNASEPDHLLFTDLPKACGVEPFTGSRKDRSGDVDRFLRGLQGALNELQRAYETLLHSLTTELARSLDVPARDAKPRQELMRRAAAVSVIALNPEIKVFTTRLAEANGEEATWVEQIAAFLASKHPAQWHDDDRGRFSVRLGQMAESFRALESLVVARTELRPADEGRESIRLAVVGTRFSEASHVIHLRTEQAEQVQGLESKIRHLIEPHARNGSREVVIAALARVTQTFLNGMAGDAKPSRGKK